MSETHQETAAASATINTILYDTLSRKWASSIQLMDTFHEMEIRERLINIFPALSFLVVSWFYTADTDTLDFSDFSYKMPKSGGMLFNIFW